MLNPTMIGKKMKKLYQISIVIASMILDPIYSLARGNSLSNTDPLSSIAIFTSTYITEGANSTLGGNVFSGAGLNTGSDTFINGSITSVSATTLGADTSVTGTIATGAATTVGAHSRVSGTITSAAAITIGASSSVSGNVAAYGAITVDASSSVGSKTKLPATASGLSDAAYIQSLDDYSTQLTQSAINLQTRLTALGTGTPILATFAAPLLAGVYSTPGYLTTAAGTKIVLDAQGKDNQEFVFNIGTYLSTGASTTVTLINPGLNDTVYWNVGTYMVTGASTIFAGTIVANGYITVGEDSTIMTISPYDGGLYSVRSYISMGADTYVGRPSVPPSSIPEPTAWTMMIVGLGMVGMSLRRRHPLMD